MSVRNRFIQDVILPLIAGSVIYWLFRGNMLFHIAPLFHLTPSGSLYAFTVYSLPDGLWLYALLGSLNLIWLPLEIAGRIWSLLAVFASLGSEIAQFYHLLPGTFDIADILAYLILSTIFFTRSITFVKKPVS